MDHIQELNAPAPRAVRRRLGDRAVLWMHREAERRDLLPAHFGVETGIDVSDARAVLGEWIRQAKLWAGDNPERMLAWKAGAVALGGALLVLVVLVRAIG